MMLAINDLYLSIGKLSLAKGLNLALEAGKIHVIIGPNGTGKSTLLKTIFGELTADSGSISLNAEQLTKKTLAKWRKNFGYMPQDTRLDINLSVLEVVLLGSLDSLNLHLDEESINKGLQALDQIGMLALADRDVNTLSGGQCQMILFAQALMRDPCVLMLDEPVSALDLHYQHVMLEHLSKQTKANQWISLMVLHDLNLAAQYADNLIVLKEGKVVVAGAPIDILNKALIKDIYQVNADVSLDVDGCPFVRTRRSDQATPQPTI